MEEIVGEINDEFDDEEKTYARINVDTFVFEGKTLLSDFCKIVNIDEEYFSEIEGEADTIAGLVLELKGDFPIIGEQLSFGGFTFKILGIDQRRITKIEVKLPTKPLDCIKKD